MQNSYLAREFLIFLPLKQLLYHDQIIFKKDVAYNKIVIFTEWVRDGLGQGEDGRKETEDYPKQSILNQLDRESLERSMINKHLLILWCAAWRCLMMYQKIKCTQKPLPILLYMCTTSKPFQKCSDMIRCVSITSCWLSLWCSGHCQREVV